MHILLDIKTVVVIGWGPILFNFSVHFHKSNTLKIDFSNLNHNHTMCLYDFFSLVSHEEQELKFSQNNNLYIMNFIYIEDSFKQ